MLRHVMQHAGMTASNSDDPCSPCSLPIAFGLFLVKVAITLTFTLCVGMWHVVMRQFGLGAIATFLSDPVLSGFSTASAFLIGTSQLKHLVGYDLPRGSLPVTW